jgi:hypothetical protein
MIDGTPFSSNGTDGMANAAYDAERGSATITSIAASRIQGAFSGVSGRACFALLYKPQAQMSEIVELAVIGAEFGDQSADLL